MQTAQVLATVGLVVFAVGMMLPAETTETQRVCLDGGDYCRDENAMTVERTTENDGKTPVMVSGAVVALVGFVLVFDEERQLEPEYPYSEHDSTNEDSGEREETYNE